MGWDKRGRAITKLQGVVAIRKDNYDYSSDCNLRPKVLMIEV